MYSYQAHFNKIIENMKPKEYPKATRRKGCYYKEIATCILTANYSLATIEANGVLFLMY